VPQLFKTDVSRIVLASGGILIVTAALCGLAGFIVMQYGAEETLGDGLARILNLRVAAMKQIIIRHTESANRFAAKPEIMQQLATIASKPTDGSLRLPLQALADKALTAGYSAVTFTNAGGAVIAAAGQEMMTADITMPLRLPNAASLSWSEQFLLITETAVSDNGKPLGSVTLQRPLPEIEKLLMDITETGETGELLICTLRNTSIACAPTRLRPRPLKVPLASGSTRGPIRLALQGRAGVTKYTDLRGKEAIAAYAPLGDLGPAMALRIDTTVLYEPILNKLTYLVPFVAVLLAAGIALQRAIVTPLAHKLARSEQRLQLALDGSRLALWDWDVSNGKVYLGEQWQVILGGQAGPSVITSAELQSMVHPEDLPTLATQLRDVLKGKLDLYDVEHRVRTLSDEWKWIHSKGKVVARSGDGRVSRMIGTNADIDEHKQAELLVEHQAKHDMLTSLPNRVLFYDRLKRATARSKRYQRLMAVLYLDIDKFKSINDNLGHAMGDALLKGFARRLADCVRQTDTVARLGGDEFTVILEELNNRDNGRAVAQKIVESMRPEFLLENRAITITTSAGMVFFEGAEDVSGDALIKKADQALYEAKGAGRNNYHEAA
jgi:diguanylate cyclase (GGDEF)-like protein